MHLILACILHPSTSHRAGWSYVIHGRLYFHPSTSSGISISAALCIQPKIWRARLFYLTRWLWFPTELTLILVVPLFHSCGCIILVLFKDFEVLFIQMHVKLYNLSNHNLALLWHIGPCFLILCWKHYAPKSCLFMYQRSVSLRE